MIDSVLQATLEQLGRVGYGELTIEAVAARAGVNRTTVYRRWPTREKLVRAALQSVALVPSPLPDTGSFRGDLLAIARESRDQLQTSLGQALVRLALAGPLEPKLLALLRTLTAAQNAGWMKAAERARARGELAARASGALVLEALGGALIHRVLLARRPADERYLAQLVELLLEGAAR